MGQGLEFIHGLLNSGWITSHTDCRQSGSSDIFKIVTALSARCCPDPDGCFGVPREEHVDVGRVNGGAIAGHAIDRRSRKEIEHPAAGGDDLLLHPGVAAVADGIVRRGLVGEQAALGCCIGLNIDISIQVVLGNVEQYRHMGMKLVHGIELKAADFGYDGIQLSVPVHDIDERIADVAAHEDTFAGCRQHATQQLRGGGFAVGAADGENGHLDMAGGQFDFADNGDAFFPCPDQGFNGQWHARADHHQIGGLKRLLVMPAQFQVQTELLRLVGSRPQSLWRWLGR